MEGEEPPTLPSEQFNLLKKTSMKYMLYKRRVLFISTLEWSNNYLCTYDLHSPVHNVLDACISIMWESGRGLGPGILGFFGPCEMGMSR